MRYPASFRTLPMPARVRWLPKFVLSVMAGFCLLPILLKLMLRNPSTVGSISFAGELILIGCVGSLALAVGFAFWLTTIVQVDLIKDGLLVHTSPFGKPGKLFPWSVFRLAEVRIARYPEAYDFLPRGNSNFHGAIRLRTGEAALAYIQDEAEPFVYLPTFQGPSLVIQVESPEEFLEMFHEFAGKAI